MMLACRTCQAQLVAYIHQELDVSRRRQVARHLDECETCYTLYLQDRDSARRLGQIVPLIGQDHRLAVKRVWQAVQQDMVHPRLVIRPYSTRYGLAMLCMSLLLLFPLTMGNRNVPPTSPATQPAPLTLQATPNSSRNAAALQISLTPEAIDKTATGPSPDAITTP